MTLTIHPLDLGTLTVDRSGLTLRTGLGNKLQISCLAWLILGGAEPVLVDTGPKPDVDWGTRYHNPFACADRQSLERQLARHGISPSEIRTVVLTHLHWDHCYGNHLLPRARFVVQRSEFEYAKDPLHCDRPIYECDINPPPYMVGVESFELVDGDFDVCRGVRTVLMPGHTPGLQGVLVQTGDRRILLGSDHFPLFENIEQNIPTGIVHSLPDWYAASARSREFCDLILPGHDWTVLNSESYQ
ncbi:N-acyl homoserine lactonase family protein [Pseudohoeflea coraliihabitans]|uniref:N-acyl homoserine lactonase family protein n=1 Tax=Pseudohoeflea coraliihabitans TaxID=2860393 RepID=A0ABS6WMJ3_9HYPH|nr:N-acyl homoserine lactonase family protein [Pseudohoeflea sp. DP4N28-3]MBW3097189.1 N-acyl homoserine lactonase family protein [Pseudohoeflea sp. DP4N28-3]